MSHPRTIDLRRLAPAALAAVAVSLASVAASSCSSSDKNVAADVTASACVPDPAGGRPAAEGQITNHSSKDSAYAFRVSFVDSAGNKVSGGPVAVAKVPARGTATWRAQGAADAKGPLTCEVGNVARTAVP